MGKSLDVLIVEDVEDDALLLIRELKRGGYEPFYKRVETAADMRAALQMRPWDIILSDYNLPQFNGMEALAIYQEAGLDIPFIIVSGTIGEDIAVAAMKGGAHDYIMKDRRQRLVPAIERELRESAIRREKRQVDESLVKNAQFLSSLMESIPNPIFCKDQQGIYRECNQAFASYLGLTREEIIGKTVYDVVPKERADTYHDMDQDLLRNGGVQFYEASVRYADGTLRDVVFNKAALKDSEGGVDGLVGVMLDITDRRQLEQERQRNLERVKNALGGTVQTIVNLVETRDPYTAGHQRHVADLATAIAADMGLDADRIEGIRMAAAIHDIGKISVPAEILSKPTRLSDIEFKLIMMHSQTGFDILRDVEFPWPVARIVLQHHERFDGSGYPQKLKGIEIIMEARILAVADVVDAIASHRPYRPAFGIATALEEIAKNRGILYDPDVVDACLRLFNNQAYKLEGEKR